MTACFVVVYRGMDAKGAKPAIEAVLTTTPPLPPLSLPIYWSPSKVPLTTAFCNKEASHFKMARFGKLFFGHLNPTFYVKSVRRLKCW